MDNLLCCDECRHGVPFHAGGGCGIASCDCANTREIIIDRALAFVRDEIHNQYWRSSDVEPGSPELRRKSA